MDMQLRRLPASDRDRIMAACRKGEPLSRGVRGEAAE
jgi:hypothetical protein